MAGAQVSLSAAGGAGMMGGGEQSALSDEGGRFRFERLNPGRYSLGASLRDQSSAPAEAVVTGDDAQEVQLVLAAGALSAASSCTCPSNSSGVDSQRPGPGLLGHRAHRLRRHVRDHRSARGRRDASSQCRRLHDRLPLGLRDGHDRPGPGRGGGRDRLRAGFPRGGTGEPGREAGNGSDGRALPDGGNRRSANGRTDEAGHYALEGLEAGQYNITASTQDGAPSVARSSSPAT